MGVTFKGLFVAVILSPSPNPVFAIRGVMSEMLLRPRNSHSRLVRLDSTDTSEMLLEERPRLLRLVKLDNGVTSEMLLEERPRYVRLVKLDNGVMSEMLLSERYRCARLVKSDNGVMSEMLLPERFSQVKLVKLDNGVTSEMRLRERSSSVKRVANSSPVKSLIFAFGAPRRVKVNISALVIGASLALPRLSAMTARKLASGMLTGVGSSIKEVIDSKTIRAEMAGSS